MNHILIPSPPKIERVARHEAGHLVMLWVLEKPVLACTITEEGGLTKPFAKWATCSPELKALYVIGGLVYGNNEKELQQLLQDQNPEHYEEESDQHILATLSQKGVDLSSVLDTARKLLMTFCLTPVCECYNTLIEKRTLDFLTIRQMFDKFDNMGWTDDDSHRLGEYSKSDIVMGRLLMGQGQKTLGKNCIPWPEGHVAAHPSIEELTDAAREELRNLK